MLTKDDAIKLQGSEARVIPQGFPTDEEMIDELDRVLGIKLGKISSPKELPVHIFHVLEVKSVCLDEKHYHSYFKYLETQGFRTRTYMDGKLRVTAVTLSGLTEV